MFLIYSIKTIRHDFFVRNLTYIHQKVLCFACYSLRFENPAEYVRQLVDETVLDVHVYNVILVRRIWNMTYHVFHVKWYTDHVT